MTLIGVIITYYYIATNLNATTVGSGHRTASTVLWIISWLLIIYAALFKRNNIKK